MRVHMRERMGLLRAGKRSQGAVNLDLQLRTRWGDVTTAAPKIR